jgi:hypothetical protein
VSVYVVIYGGGKSLWIAIYKKVCELQVSRRLHLAIQIHISRRRVGYTSCKGYSQIKDISKFYHWLSSIVCVVLVRSFCA